MSIPKKVREQLRERAGAACEICGSFGATNAHHRRNRSQVGKDVLSNLMLLCGSGTTGCHGRVTTRPAWSVESGYTIHGTVADPATVPLIYRGRLVLLDNYGDVIEQEVPWT